MSRKEKKHQKKQEKERFKKKDIDLLFESKINLKLDNIMKKNILIKLMIENNHHIIKKTE